MALANPAVLFQCFLMAAVVLYGWFANRFFAYVIIRKLKMSKKQKDWLQVNAIVAFLFSVMGISSCIAITVDPQQLDEIIKTLPADAGVTSNIIVNVAYGLLAVCTVLLAHIIWTYLLVRKNKEYFET
ncbi:MAG: hypothetical protein ABIO05_00940 [Ferruginibacter sp.]